MPLARYDAETYLKCERVFVNTDEKNAERSRSNFDIVAEFDQLYEKVVAIELVSWHIPFDISPIFSDGTDGRAQNNFLDFTFTTLATAPSHPDTHSTTVELDNVGFGTFQQLATYLKEKVEDQLRDDGDVIFDPDAGFAFTMEFTVVDGCKINFSAQFQDVGMTVVQPSVNVEILFGSGANTGLTPWQELGFASETDTLVSSSPLITAPTSQFPIILAPERWVDVVVEQAGELDPVARIPISGEGYDTDLYHVNRPRLLLNPIKNMQEIRVRLVMADGKEPTPVSSNGFDLVFDLLVLVPDQCVPSWVRQHLQYK